MQQFHAQRKKEPFLASVGRCTISCILALLTQYALSLVPRFFSASFLLIQLALSVVVLLLVVGFGKWCRKLLGVSASAPAFVFFNILFVWVVYFVIVRQAIPYFIDAVFNGEVAMLFIGVCSILSSDPGLVTHGSSHSDKLDEIKAFEVEVQNESSSLLKRVRYCKSCEAYVKGFDHHCPAFGNCIGQNNHVLFMVLLLGFLTTEASYVMCSFQFARDSKILGGNRFEIGLAGSLVISTMLFTLLQVLWQINWRKYPEFQVIIQSQPDRSFTEMRFTNPYDKGIVQNVKEFFTVRD
ncbi:putative ZDHHC-type palmitoyltransferase 6 isoform X2 [Manihot esculenta]|uniref:putative ZDHHC-type palmitoyltransferase 6 isoform X2 n=1 Tax=Manihot esculenta TaxID=3983 RepID=UPI001CC4731F|nr:putative ZDHHC-type palmitoyltransferase 6 isoform X2 [Manihot esculenta]